jgi:hypothetical protein
MALALLSCQLAYSQDVVVIGTVSNGQSLPVAGAEVRLGPLNGKSNSKGVFTFKVNKFPVTLTIKHRLYNNYIEVVRAPINKQDTIFLDIILENKSTELDEVTVSASKITWV